MTFDEMLFEIGRVFDCDPLKLEMLRRDVCVDVVGTILNWFKGTGDIQKKNYVYYRSTGHRGRCGLPRSEEVIAERFQRAIKGAPGASRGCCSDRLGLA